MKRLSYADNYDATATLDDGSCICAAGYTAVGAGAQTCVANEDCGSLVEL